MTRRTNSITSFSCVRPHSVWHRCFFFFYGFGRGLFLGVSDEEHDWRFAIVRTRSSTRGWWSPRGFFGASIGLFHYLTFFPLVSWSQRCINSAQAGEASCLSFHVSKLLFSLLLDNSILFRTYSSLHYSWFIPGHVIERDDDRVHLSSIATIVKFIR